MKERHPDAKRLLAEIASLYVACDDCGHSRILRGENLKAAQSLGVQTYQDLCRKVRCGECPRKRLPDRNLTIRPTWRCEGVAEVA